MTDGSGVVDMDNGLPLGGARRLSRRLFAGAPPVAGDGVDGVLSPGRLNDAERDDPAEPTSVNM